MKIIAIIPTDLLTNLLLSFFLSFLTSQKEESSFQLVGDLVTKNFFLLFIESHVLLQSHDAKFSRPL